jgi:hypothetical protein
VGYGGEVRIPGGQRRLLISTQQPPLRQVIQATLLLLGLHQRATVQTIQHPARPQVNIQRDFANGRTVGAVVQRRIDMGAGVGRQGYAPDVYRAIVAELPVWGLDYVDRARNLRVHMAHLRQKLQVDPAQPQYFITELQVGYRLMGV